MAPRHGSVRGLGWRLSHRPGGPRGLEDPGSPAAPRPLPPATLRGRSCRRPRRRVRHFGQGQGEHRGAPRRHARHLRLSAFTGLFDPIQPSAHPLWPDRAMSSWILSGPSLATLWPRIDPLWPVKAGAARLPRVRESSGASSPNGLDRSRRPESARVFHAIGKSRRHGQATENHDRSRRLWRTPLYQGSAYPGVGHSFHARSGCQPRRDPCGLPLP